MKQSKRQKLEAADWKVSKVQDFLGLTDEKQAYVEMKLSRDKAPKQY